MLKLILNHFDIIRIQLSVEITFFLSNFTYFLTEFDKKLEYIKLQISPSIVQLHIRNKIKNFLSIKDQIFEMYTSIFLRNFTLQSNLGICTHSDRPQLHVVISVLKAQ